MNSAEVIAIHHQGLRQAMIDLYRDFPDHPSLAIYLARWDQLKDDMLTDIAAIEQKHGALEWKLIDGQLTASKPIFPEDACYGHCSAS